MSAIANVVGKNWDGAITGATGTHTYVPTVIDQNGVAMWSLDGAVYDANKRLSLSVRRPTKGSQVIRVQLKLAHPLMDATDTTLKIGECLISVEAVFPKRAAQADRDLLMGDLVYMLNEDSAITNAFSILASVY